MITSVSAKRCPECGKAAVLHALLCESCGHRFRTRFVEPQHRTESFTIALVPPVAAAKPARRLRATRTFGTAFLTSFLLVAVVGGLLWLGGSLWGWTGPQAALFPSAAPPVVSASAGAARAIVPHPAAINPARRLYNAIDLAMSLYQLDNAAGGTGRVIPVADPHTLLLSYDYPHQSVHVSLSRTDLTSGDFQVQAIALYHDKTLLQRRAQVD